MTAARPKPEPERAAGPDPDAPGKDDRAPAAPRRVDEPPALIVVLAPVIGLLLWVGLIALVL